MNNIEQMKELAFLYLDGNSDVDIERKLWEFLSQKEENRLLFSQWESEWKIKRDKAPKLSMLAGIEDRITGRRKRISVICSVAAAVVVTVVTSLFLTRQDAVPSVNVTDSMTVVETGPCDRTKVALPDGSTVWLNSCSRLAYTGEFNRTERRLELSGEAFFDVKTDPSRLFIVDMGQEKITVKGTKFNVSAYHKTGSMSVALIDGKVEFSEGETMLSINPGEVVVYDKSSRNLTKSVVDDVSRYCTWTEGRIDYPSVTLDVLFDRLSCIYNLDIRYTPRKLSGKTFSISLSTQENIKDVLDAIAVIMPVKWTKDDRTIIINEI